MLYADGVTSYAEWVVGMPSDWNGGTVTAIFYWLAITDTGTGSTVFGIAGVSYGEGDLRDIAFGAAVEVTDNNISTALQVHLSSATGAVTITGAAASEMVCFRAYRKSDAGITGGVRLLGIMINYTRT